MAIRPVCTIPDCGKPHYGHGLCNVHCYRLRRYGDPLAGRTLNGEPERYLRDVVLVHDSNECLLWPYAKARGYGVINSGDERYVHRLVCEIAHGQPPSPNYEAAHRCGNGHLGCVAKRHLSWKTSAENKADQLIHGTRNRGGRNGSAKLTSDDVLAIRSLQGQFTQAALARKFGTTQQAISDIHTRRRWGWLD